MVNSYQSVQQFLRQCRSRTIGYKLYFFLSQTHNVTVSLSVRSSPQLTVGISENSFLTGKYKHVFRIVILNMVVLMILMWEKNNSMR